ncbi:MAG: DNA-binding transcriptional regulator [Hyphomicrobiaceae bacterium]
MTKTYKSKILASVHEAMQDAHDAGVIGKTTMREFDATCLTEVAKLSPEEIVALREREGVSQAVFARHLNVAVKLVGEWERGQKRPSGPSLKLLSLIKAKGLEAVV